MIYSSVIPLITNLVLVARALLRSTKLQFSYSKQHIFIVHRHIIFGVVYILYQEIYGLY